MDLLLNQEDVRKAVRAYVKAKGYVLAVEKTTNQHTGLLFTWDEDGWDKRNKLQVKVKLKEVK